MSDSSTLSQNQVLSTAEQISDLAALLKKETIIAFDTEFIRESTFYPIVEIIQIATRDRAWIVDAQVFKKAFRPGTQGGFDSSIQPLLDVFSDPQILKVVHAAQGDQECLFTSFGCVASPTLDTAVAASLLGWGDTIGLGKLLKIGLDVTIKKGHARTNWSVRPLPPQLLEYARADVEHLVVLAELLLKKLDEMWRRAWALELSSKSQDPSLYEADCDSLVHKLTRGGRVDRTGSAVLRELVQWREERVRQLNLPRRWVADDAVLLDLAQVRPKDLEHLAAFRGLNRGEVKQSGQAILDLISKGVAAAAESKGQDSGAAKNAPREGLPTADEAQVLELLKCYVGILAEEHRIATRHLAGSNRLLPLLRRSFKTKEEIVAAGVLGPEAVDLIGDDLLAFLQGKRALSVRKGRVHCVDLPS